MSRCLEIFPIINCKKSSHGYHIRASFDGQIWLVSSLYGVLYLGVVDAASEIHVGRTSSWKDFEGDVHT